MNIDQQVKEHLMDFPLDLTDVLRACICVIGLADVLSGIGELFGNSGQEGQDEACWDGESCRKRAACPRAS